MNTWPALASSSETTLKRISERFQLNPVETLISNTPESQEITEEVAIQVYKCIQSGWVVVITNWELITCYPWSMAYHDIISSWKQTYQQWEPMNKEWITEIVNLSKSSGNELVISLNPYNRNIHVSTYTSEEKWWDNNDDDTVVLKITKDGVEKTLNWEKKYW